MVHENINRGSLNLELLGYDCGWQKATKVVCLTLFLCERKPLVVAWIPQQIVAAATHQTSTNFRMPNYDLKQTKQIFLQYL